MSRKLDAALEYASYGWKVVRLYTVRSDGACSCKAGADCPQKSRGKHPVGRDWQLNATDDEDTIIRWWEDMPDANVGILLGPKSGIIDIEFDDEAGRAFADKVLIECYTPTYQSGRSVHRLFKYTDELPAVTVPHINGLEFRLGQSTKGAQSVAPPSDHWTGVKYQWLPGLSPSEVSVAEIPPELLLMLQNPELNTVVTEERQKSARHKLYEQRVIRETIDGRDDTLYKQACSIWREQFQLKGGKIFGDPEMQARVFKEIWVWNKAMCEPPLDDATLAVKVESARKFIEGAVRDDNAKTGVSMTGMGLEFREGEWWPGQWRLTIVMSDPVRYLLHVPAWEHWCDMIHLSVEEYSDPTKVAKAVLAATKCVILDDQPGRWPVIWNGKKSTKTQEGFRGLKAKLMDVATQVDAIADDRRQYIVAEILYEAISKATHGATEPDPRGRPVVMEDGSVWLRWQRFWSQFTKYGEVQVKEVQELTRMLGVTSANSKVHTSGESRARYTVLFHDNMARLESVLGMKQETQYIGAKNQ